MSTEVFYLSGLDPVRFEILNPNGSVEWLTDHGAKKIEPSLGHLALLVPRNIASEFVDQGVPDIQRDSAGLSSVSTPSEREEIRRQSAIAAIDRMCAVKLD